MAYQMVATSVTLFTACRRFQMQSVELLQHFTRFQLTVCSRGSSALAELLVNLNFERFPKEK